MSNGNSYKIDKNLVKHVTIAVVAVVVWLGLNLAIITKIGHITPPLFIAGVGVVIYWKVIKPRLDERYTLTKKSDSEQKVQVTLTVEQYKKLREIENEQYDQQHVEQDS